MTATKILLPVVLVLAIVIPLQLTGCPPPKSESLPVINYFRAFQTTIHSGDATLLSWDITGATIVSIDQGIGDVDLRSQTVIAPDETTLYHLTASNSAGTVTASAEVIVKGFSPHPSGVPVIEDFRAYPTTIKRGEWAKLYWAVDNATGATLNSVPVSATNILEVHPESTTTYTLTALSPEGDVSDTVQITVSGVVPWLIPPPTFSFDAATYTNSVYGFYFLYPKDWVERPDMVSNPERVAAFSVQDFVPGIVFEVSDKPGPETANGILAWLNARGYSDSKLLTKINPDALASGTPAYTYKVSFTSATGYAMVAYVLDTYRENTRFRMMVYTVDEFSPYDDALFSEIAHTLQLLEYCP